MELIALPRRREDKGTVTAYRPPRGGKSEKSGENRKRGARSGAARSPSRSLFSQAARIATARNSRFNRLPLPSGSRTARAAIHDGAQQPARPQHGGGLDAAALGRAEAAYKSEFDKWQAQIDAVIADKSLSPDQRVTALAALRAKQQIEASGARKRVIEEERQRARAGRRAARSILNPWPAPQG